ncbi:hypothetical protein E4U21_001053 [Claviceps maximensis]|nr:hypothetical protein E4U21_001053 [Claviceps maximensis]
MDANNSERTLVNVLEMEKLSSCHLDNKRQRQLSTSTAASQEHEQNTGKNNIKDGRTIECRVDYCVVQDDRFAEELGNYTGIWAGDTGKSVPQIRSRYFGDHIHQNSYYYNNKT